MDLHRDFRDLLAEFVREKVEFGYTKPRATKDLDVLVAGSSENPVIIVPAATGVVYCNQVDGVTTQHLELEGYLIPLPKLDVTNACGEIPRDVRVDRDASNFEAWIHVRFVFPTLDSEADEIGTMPIAGVLTWENSD